MNLYVFIIFIIILPISYIYAPCTVVKPCPCITFPMDDVDEDLKYPVQNSMQRPYCGEYGFKCLNKHAYQICELPEDQHSDRIVDTPLIRECGEGYECDEENPAFCTPINNTKMVFMKNPNGQNCDFAENTLNNENQDFSDADIDDGNYLDELENSKEFLEDSRDTRNLKCSGECIECKGPIITPTDCIDTIMPEEPTIEPTTIPVPEISDYNCQIPGYYPDTRNKSTFWSCDIRCDGVGLIASRMTCKSGEIFSKDFHACVIPEVALECRNKKNSENSNKISFSCNGKRSGKYSDMNNCRYYHMCVNNKLSPIKELLFVCPESTAYDPQLQKCTKSAIARCVNNCPKPKKSSFCQGIPSRFRQISDCRSYYLCKARDIRAVKITCPNGYSVDDYYMDCLPNRIARCIEDY